MFLNPCPVSYLPSQLLYAHVNESYLSELLNTEVCALLFFCSGTMYTHEWQAEALLDTTMRCWTTLYLWCTKDAKRDYASCRGRTGLNYSLISDVNRKRMVRDNEKAPLVLAQPFLLGSETNLSEIGVIHFLWMQNLQFEPKQIYQK